MSSEKRIAGARFAPPRLRPVQPNEFGARIGRTGPSADARFRKNVGWLVRRFGHKSGSGARHGVGRLNRLSQALKVRRKKIVRTWSRVEDPSIGNDELGASMGDLSIVQLRVIGMIVPTTIELRASIPKDWRESIFFERR